MSTQKCSLTYTIDTGLHWYGKAESRAGRKMAHYTITASDHNELIDKLSSLGIHGDEHKLERSGARVGIIMGSDSDLPCMQDAAKVSLAYRALS